MRSRDLCSNLFLTFKVESILSNQTIFFQKTKDPYGEFSNFYPSPITYDGRQWSTLEHLYQAFKFEDISIQEKIRVLPSPMGAAIEGRNPNNPMRLNWDEIKEDVMMTCLRAKFEQNPRLKQLLLSTGSQHLAELSYKDHYWGTPPDGSGYNRLGELLMRLRYVFFVLD